MRRGFKSYLFWLAVSLLMFLVVFHVEFLKPSQLQPVSYEAITMQSRQPSLRRNLLQTHTQSRYILGLNYWEQLTMGVRNLFQLACVGTVLNLSLVQPFQYNSRLYGLPNFKPDGNINASRRAEDLGLVFNTESINNGLKRNHLLPMRTFENFLNNAQRRLTVIHFIHPSKEVHELPVMKGESGAAITQGFQKSNVFDCSTILAGYGRLILDNLNQELNSTGQFGTLFSIGKYFCVSMNVMSTPGELAKAVGLGDLKESVVVVNWRGTSFTTFVSNTAKGNHSNNRIAMNSVCHSKKIIKNQGLLSYSNLVRDSAARFLRDHGLKSRGYVGIHIRSEKIGQRQSRFPGTLKLCLSKVSRIVESLGNCSFVYIVDFGPYSSDTCKHCSSGEKTIHWIEKQVSHPYSYWLRFSPPDYQLPEDSGLAAGVEATVLAGGSHLVVCGGGAFQTQIVDRFSHNNSRTNIFKQCTEDSDFSSVLVATPNHH